MQHNSMATKSRTKAPSKEQILTRDFCLIPAPSSWFMPSKRLFLFLALIPVIIKANIPTLHQKPLIPFSCNSDLMSARFDCWGVKAGDGAAVMAGLGVCLKSPTACTGRGISFTLSHLPVQWERVNPGEAIPCSYRLVISGSFSTVSRICLPSEGGEKLGHSSSWNIFASRQ